MKNYHPSHQTLTSRRGPSIAAKRRRRPEVAAHWPAQSGDLTLLARCCQQLKIQILPTEVEANLPFYSTKYKLTAVFVFNIALVNISYGAYRTKLLLINYKLWGNIEQNCY